MNSGTTSEPPLVTFRKRILKNVAKLLTIMYKHFSQKYEF